MDTVISTENLQKRYGQTVAVNEVTFDVRRGEIFGILGPNGAGKTTTVEILQGLRHRDGGRLAVLGLDPSRDAGKLRRRTGSQLQSSALPERLRVGEAIRLFARLHKGPIDVDSVLSEWGLRDLRRRAYATLSGGQQQRLFLALALLGQPEIVFLDELTTGLDPTARRATWNLVRQVRDRGATIVLVTHFMEEAEALCDRIAVVDRGRVVALDPPGALTANRGGPVRTTFTVNDHDPSYLSAVPGVDAVTMDASRVTVTGSGAATVAVAAALAAHDVAPADFRTHHPSLEDVFLALTGRSLMDGDRS